MTLKALAKKYDMTEDDLSYAFTEMGFLKSNGTPAAKYVKSGMFTSNGDYNYKKDFVQQFEDMLPEIKELANVKQIEELTEQVSVLAENQEKLMEMVSQVISKLDEFEVEEEEEKPKKEKKPRNIDMSSRARSLIGKKVNGWTISGDKLDVVATKPGKEEIRVPGMKKKDDLLEMLS